MALHLSLSRSAALFIHFFPSEINCCIVLSSKQGNHSLLPNSKVWPDKDPCCAMLGCFCTKEVATTPATSNHQPPASLALTFATLQLPIA